MRNSPQAHCDITGYDDAAVGDDDDDDELPLPPVLLLADEEEVVAMDRQNRWETHNRAATAKGKEEREDPNIRDFIEKVR